MAIYLDTARMGRLCRRSWIVVADSIRLYREEGSSVLLDAFVRGGFNDLSPSLRADYPGLTDWRGIGALKAGLLDLAGAPNRSDVLFAASSAQLVRVAARAMFVSCQNVLTVDDSWPDYRNCFQDECVRSGRKLSEVPIRRAIIEKNLSKEVVLQRIIEVYDRERCDGIFIPSVSNLGIRLPVAEIAESVRQVKPPRFVVVDGAQEFCHAPGTACTAGCDVYITGCHKWMQAFLPMRLGICGRPDSQRFIQDTYNSMLARRQIDDPLLRFSRQLEDNDFHPFTETADLLPLFSCAGAVQEQQNLAVSLPERFKCQLANAMQLRAFSADTEWCIILPDGSFRSGIVLMECLDPFVRQLSADQLRLWFRHWGLVVSAYANGLIRLSMPTRPWTNEEVCLLQRALASVGRRPRNPRNTPSDASREWVGREAAGNRPCADMSDSVPRGTRS